jgi:hypothetical protein
MSIAKSIIISSAIACSSLFATTMHYSFDNKSFDKNVSNITDVNDIDIDVSGLDEGIHTIYFRVMDDDNVTSNISKRMFRVYEEITPKVHYSIGNKSFDTSVDYSSDFDIDVSGFDDGLHTIYLRTTDENNITSNIVKRMIIINDKAVSGYIPPVVGVNYSIDTNDTNISVSSGDDLNISIYNIGTHSLSLQAYNSNGVVSSIYKTNFDIVEDIINTDDNKTDSNTTNTTPDDTNTTTQTPINSEENTKTLTAGWNLTALPTRNYYDMTFGRGIGISKFKMIWDYEGGLWTAMASTSDTSISNALTRAGIISIMNIDNTKGYWVLTADNTSTIEFDEEDNQNNIDYSTLSSGWHLVSSTDITNPSNQFANIKSAWTYKNGTWYAYSPDSKTQEAISNHPNIQTLQNISKYDGFWIHK